MYGTRLFGTPLGNSPKRPDPKLCSLPNVTYIHVGENLGYGAGHNIAIRIAIESNSDFHFVLNPDIFFKSDALHQMIERMRKDPSIGQLMPKVLQLELLQLLISATPKSH